MIVLKPILTPQSFAVTIRGCNADSIVLREEGHGQEYTFNVISISNKSNFEFVTAQFNILKEGQFYQVLIKNSDDIVCRERLFVTAQNPADYSPNKNEYIIYE
jgi:hypothetical protein